MALTVILPQNEYSRALGDTLAPLLPPDVSWRDPAEGLEGLAGARLLFAVALDEGGCNMGCWGSSPSCAALPACWRAAWGPLW